MNAEILDRDIQQAAMTYSDKFNDLKLEINRLIWQYAPPETTLGTADDMACKILESILAGKYLQ